MRSACEKAASDALKTAGELYEKKKGTHSALPTGGGRGSGGEGVGEVDMKEFLFRRGRERSDVRLGFGGSSMHLDGMGTMTAIGAAKHGMNLSQPSNLVTQFFLSISSSFVYMQSPEVVHFYSTSQLIESFLKTYPILSRNCGRGMV